MILEREIALGKRLEVLQGDLTLEATDAIVNAANASLLGGGGVDGAIHRAAGPTLLEECRAVRARSGPCAPGDAVITSGGRLKARYVIHTVGPIWQGGTADEAETLASCYRRALELASAHALTSIAFPSISTGAFRYPVHEASRVALASVRGFLRSHATAPSLVRWVLFDERTFDAYAGALRGLLDS